jgi:flagellum-specific peptidoglycan hydrolase FlgJ
MASPSQLAFLAKMYEAAKVSGHIFPDAAACEAVVETAWGTSTLYLQANNVFGSKTPEKPLYPSIQLPTKEQLPNGEWVTVSASFVSYPTVAESFEDRMATLIRLAPTYPNYNEALHATTPEDYLVWVSRSWSTGIMRGTACVSILHAHRDIFTSAVTA